MKSPDERNCTRRERRSFMDEVEDLAYAPSGGRGKQWFAGVVLAAVPVIYGIHSIERGYATLPGRGGVSEKLTGEAGMWLAVASIAFGAFLHFHFFWGLSERLWRFSEALKVVSMLVLLAAFCRALYLAFV
jgi:hypothetical protein